MCVEARQVLSILNNCSTYCLGWATPCKTSTRPWNPRTRVRMHMEHQVRNSESNSAARRKISDSVHELYAPSSGKVEMDILFFHGLQLQENESEPHISTWRSRTPEREVWPERWLPRDFPKARVLTVSYDNSMKQDDTRGRMDMHLVVENLLESLLLAGVGRDCPLILVGHSFGGLIMKQLCLEAHEKTHLWPEPRCKKVAAFLQYVKAMFYFATPHHGTRFTDVIGKFNLKEGDLLNHVKVFSKNLARLNQDFNQLRAKHCDWQVAGIGESLPTQLVYRGKKLTTVVVEEGSARYESFFTVLEDHISICQPKAKESITYQSFRNFVFDVQQTKVTETLVEGTGQSTLLASEDIADIQSQIGGSPNIPSMLTVLFSTDSTPVQLDISFLLFRLSKSEVYKKFFFDAEVPNVIEELVRLFCSSDNINLQINVAGILWCLSNGNADIQSRVGGTPRTIWRMITILFSTEFPPLQYNISGLLLQLSMIEANKRLFYDVSGVIQGLIRLFYSCSDRVNLQMGIAGILSNLSSNSDIQSQIGATAGTISRMLTISFSTEFLPLQNSVSGLLLQLSMFEPNRKLFIEVPDVIEKLIRLFFSSDSTVLQVNILGILWNLSYGNSDIQSRVGGVAGTISRMLSIFVSTELPGLQNNISGLLLQLSMLEANKRLFCEVPAVIEELVRLFLNSDGVDLHIQVAGILWSLSDGNSDIPIRIGKVVGAISRMIVILCSTESSPLRINVGGLLIVLSSFQANKKFFSEIPDAIEELVRLFHRSDHDSVDLQIKISLLLCNLSERNPHIQSRIGRTAGTISRMLSIFFSTELPVLQNNISVLLLQLSMFEANKKFFYEVSGVIEELVSLFLKLSSDSVYLQTRIAGILWMLSKGNSNVQNRIGRTTGTISRMLKILFSAEFPLLQHNISYLLLELSMYGTNKRLFSEVPECVEELIKLFLKSDTAHLQSTIAGILWNLSRENSYIRSRVGSTAGTISKMLTIILSTESSPTRHNTIGLLYQLSESDIQSWVRETPRGISMMLRVLCSTKTSLELRIFIFGLLVEMNLTPQAIKFMSFSFFILVLGIVYKVFFLH